MILERLTVNGAPAAGRPGTSTLGFHLLRLVLISGSPLWCRVVALLSCAAQHHPLSKKRSPRACETFSHIHTAQYCMCAHSLIKQLSGSSGCGRRADLPLVQCLGVGSADEHIDLFRCKNPSSCVCSTPEKRRTVRPSPPLATYLDANMIHSRP